MNTQLYDSLKSAREFLVTIEQNEKDLLYRAEHIKAVYVDRYILSGKEKPKKFSWLKFYLLLCLDGIGIIYALYIYFHNRKAKKKAIKTRWNCQFVRNNQQKAGRRKNREIKLNEYKKFYSDNYWNKIGFLPEWQRKFKTVDDISRTIKYVDGLIRHVKNGAKTLDEAMKNYGQELRMLAEIEEQREYREHLEEINKQQIDALNRIAKNQEKANDEIEKIRRKYVDRW